MEEKMVIKSCEKPPKINWKAGVKATDKGYICPTITLAVKDDDLYIRLQRYDRKAFYWLIEGYKNYTALKVLSVCSFGRHFESLVLSFWKENNLRIGLTERVLKDVRS